MKNLSNIQLETQVIGALIRAGERGNRDLVFETDALLRSSDVFSTEGGAIRRQTYDAILVIAKEGAPPSRHLINERLRKEKVVGVDFVEAAADAASLTNREAYVMALNALVESHQARLVARLLEDGSRSILSGKDSSTVATEVSRELLRATDRQERDGGDLGTLARAYEASMRDQTTEPESMWWVRWGIEEVDMMLGAQVRGGQLVCIGGHTGSGKSITMGDLIRANGVRGDLIPVGISLEMPSRDIFDRLLSSVASVPYEQVRDRKISPQFMDAHNEGLRILRDARSDHAWVEHIPWAHLREVEAKIRNVHATYGSRLIIVDYIQLVRTERNHNRELEVTEVVRTLKKLASELDIVIVGLYQLNDEMFKRSGGDRRPRSNEARESKNIEKDADVSMVIDNPTTRKDSAFWDEAAASVALQYQGEKYHLARFNFDKTRRGSKGEVTVGWCGKFQRFEQVPSGIVIPRGYSAYHDNADPVGLNHVI